MKKRYLTNGDCAYAAGRMYDLILSYRMGGPTRVWGVPRGGIPVAYLIHGMDRIAVVTSLSDTDVVVDDVIDSGRTKSLYLGKPFFALADFLEEKKKDGEWLVFPWEQGVNGKDQSADDIVIRLLEYIGEDPKRGGLLETPRRVLKAWEDWTSGYNQNPQEILKCFEDGSESYDEMILVKNTPFYSICEHHLAPFFGTITVGYVPDGRIIGLSKISRVISIFAKRLQVQERLTTQIADALNENLKPKGVAVMVKARHLCMESRGISQQGHTTITSAIRGVFMDDVKAREEFLSIAK